MKLWGLLETESDRGEIVLLIFFWPLLFCGGHFHSRACEASSSDRPTCWGPFLLLLLLFLFPPFGVCQGGSQPPLGKRGERTYTFLCQFSLTFSLRARPREQKRKCCQWAQGTSNQRLGGDTQFLGTLVSLCKHFVFFSCRSVCGVVAFYFWMEGTGSPRPVGEAQGKELQKPLGTLRFLM